MFHLCLVCIQSSKNTLSLTPRWAGLFSPKWKIMKTTNFLGFFQFKSLFLLKKTLWNLRSENWVYNLELLSSDTAWKCSPKAFVLWWAPLYTSEKNRSDVTLTRSLETRTPHNTGIHTCHAYTHARSSSCLLNYLLTEEPSWVTKRARHPLWFRLTSCAHGGHIAVL